MDRSSELTREPEKALQPRKQENGGSLIGKATAMNHPIRTLLRELFFDPILRLLRIPPK
jgi:hypothetical protein